MRKSFDRLSLAPCFLLFAPLIAHATPLCPQNGDAPLSEVADTLKPGSWFPADAFDTYGRRENPLGTSHETFREQITVAHELLEVRGFIESDDTGRGTILIMARAKDGLCVLNIWQSPARSRFRRLSIISKWRANNSKCALFLLEASSKPNNDGEPIVSLSLVLTTDGKRVWKVFEKDSEGLAFDPQPGTVALLGAGEPLFLDDTGQFRTRFASSKGATARTEGEPPRCSKTANKSLGGNPEYPLRHESKLLRDTWIPNDSPSQLYSLWENDSLAKVAFRKLLAVGGREIEAVGITGDDATLVFLAPAQKGFCVLNSLNWAFGGNGTSFKSPLWWRSKNRKLSVLLLDVEFYFHHGAGPEDTRSGEDHVALSVDGIRVRYATESEETLARSSSNKP